MYGGIPPLTEAVTSPSHEPLQSVLFPEIEIIIGFGSLIVTHSESVQLLRSFTIIPYEPAHKLLAEFPFIEGNDDVNAQLSNQE